MEDHLVNLDGLEYHYNSWLEAQQSQVLIPRVEYLGHMIHGNGLIIYIQLLE